MSISSKKTISRDSKEQKEIKDLFKNNDLRNSIQNLSMVLHNSIVKDNNLINVIINNLKDKKDVFQNSKGKFEIKIFINILLYELHYIISHIQNKNKAFFDVTVKTKVINFLKYFFFDDLHEDINLSNEDFIKNISSDSNINDSLIMSLFKILLYLNKNGFNDFFNQYFSKEKSDIGFIIIKILHSLYEIKKFVFEQNNTYSNNDKKFVNNAINYSYPFILDYLINIDLEYNAKYTTLSIVNSDNYEILFEDLSNEPELRKKILTMFKRNYYKDDEYKKIKQFIQENKSLETLFSNLKKNFQNDINQRNHFFSEVKSFFLIQTDFMIESADKKTKFEKNKSYYDISDMSYMIQYITYLIDEDNKLTNNNNFYDEFEKQFIKEIIKITSKNQEIQFIFINFLIELLLNLKEHIYKKNTSKIIFDIINNNISNYQEIKKKTNFLDLFIPEICNSEKDTISIFFAFLMSIGNADDELKQISCSLSNCDDTETLNNILKYITQYYDNNNNSFSKFMESFIKKLYEIINNFKNNNNEDKKLKKEIIENLLDFCEKSIRKRPELFEKFKEYNFISFIKNWNELKEDCTIIYKLIKIYIEHLKEEEIINKTSIQSLVESILERYLTISSQNEFNNLSETIKEIGNIYLTLKILFSRKKLKEPLNENMKKCVFNLCDYLSKCKECFNEEIHNCLKNYFEYIMSLVINQNELIFQKNKIDYPEISNNEIKKIIYEIIILESELNKKDFLLDMIKYIIDYSINQNNNIKNKNNNLTGKLMNSDFKVIYCNKFIISSDLLKNSYNSISNYTNFILMNPLPILFAFQILIKLNKYVFEMLDFIIFLFEVNDGNIKLCLRNNIIKILFKLMNNEKISNTKLYELIYRGFSLLTKFLNKFLFQDLILEILLFINNKSNPDYLKISTEILSILSTNIKITSDFNTGIILTNINIKQSNIFNNIEINDIIIPNKEDTVRIQQNFYYFPSNEPIDYFYLLEIKKNKTFIKIYLKNLNLIVDEGLKEENNKPEKNIYDILRPNENNSFSFHFYSREKNHLSISINNKEVFSEQIKFNLNDLKPNNFFIGYKCNYVKDIIFDKCFSFPHIKLYKMQIFTEHSLIYNFNSKNIFFDLKSKDKINIFLDKNTKLFYKYSFVEWAKNSGILRKNNLTSQLYNYAIYPDTYISKELEFINLEKFIFILLNEDNITKEFFDIVIQLFINYFDILYNSEISIQFFEKKEYFNLFYFSLEKNKQFIDRNIIDRLYAIIRLTEVKDIIISNIFLNHNLFESLSFEIKKEILNLINTDLKYYSNLKLEVILDKLIFLVLVSNNEEEIDEKIISIILEIIKKYFPEKDNKIDTSFSEKIMDKSKEILEKIKRFIEIIYNFNSYIDKHLINLHKNSDNLKKILKNIFKKIFLKQEINIEEIIKYINGHKNIEEKHKRDLPKLNNPLKNSLVLSFKNNSILNDIEMENENENSFSERRLSYTGGKIPNKNEDCFPKEKTSNQSLFNRAKKRRKTLDNNTNSINTNDFYVEGEILGSENKDDIIAMENYKIPVVINKNKICTGNCCLCQFIREYMKNLFFHHIGFNDYKRNLMKIYSDFYLLNSNLNFNFSFSFYLMKREGPSRKRKKFILKPDKILNNEIDRSEINNRKNSMNNENNNNEEKEKKVENEFNIKFNFYNVNNHLYEFFSLEQIFQINFIENTIDKKDKYQRAYNCLLSKGMTYLNSVIILGKKKVYLLSNVNLYQDKLYFVNKPINRVFWVKTDTKYLEEQCQILNYAKNSDKEINEIDKFNRLKKDLDIMSFSYNEINEIHTNKFLHQDNSIEIFLKNGLNFYIAYNPEEGNSILKNIIEYLKQSYIERKKQLNKEINVSELFQNLTFSNLSLKNSNLIFMRNSNIIIEKSKFDLHFHNNVENKKEKNIKFKKKKFIIKEKNKFLENVLEKWQNGIINTYDYIMILNTLSGRTYNDLNQYPIYPWVIKEYSSEEINLNSDEIYRNFQYPIYAQKKEIQEKLKIKFEEFETEDDKYHCGSHYSNPGFVCYYLIRIKPFSLISAEIQGGNFDVPDRLFFDIKSFYSIDEKYQELIPDIFNLPELYVNFNNFIFGNSSVNNIKVFNVILPKWSKNSPRLFSKMLEKSLESVFVSNHINEWIDLIFGYKQKGDEAIKSFNVLRKVCSELEIKDNNDESIEDKINEILNMGINPIQLFNKSHPKREKYKKINAIFGKADFLYNIIKGKEYKIDNFNGKNVKEMFKYYEYVNENYSQSEGGISSFKIVYNDNEHTKGKEKEKEKENIIYFFCSDNKILLPPTYKNYIEFSSDNGIYNPSNSFSIIKPYHSIKFTYILEHNNSVINCIKATNDGKYLIIGFLNGVIEKYKIKKIKNDIINKKQEKPKEKKKSSIFIKLIPKKKKNKYDTYIPNNDNNSPIIPNRINPGSIISNVTSSSSITLKTNESNNYYPINGIEFNSDIVMSNSNILNNDCILLNNNNKLFITYKPIIKINPFKNINEINGFSYHCENEQKTYSKFGENDKNISNIYILLINSSNIISNSINIIDICESYSMLIIIDSINIIYLFDLLSFRLLRKINYLKLTNFTKKIKFTSICHNTGDFIVSSSREVTLFNINGVILSKLKLDNSKSKINSCFIKNIENTKSDINLFTGHQNGNIIIWKLINLHYENKEKVIYPYNLCYNKEHQFNTFQLSLYFDELIRIDTINYPIKFIRLSEDMMKIICIAGDYFITLRYDDKNKNDKNKEKKDKEKKKKEKKCNLCNKSISSSKIVCTICGKKLCSNCKTEGIIPEISLKNKEPICEECISIINSSKKTLYDF